MHKKNGKEVGESYEQDILNTSLEHYKSQSDLLNSIEKFILNLSIDENSYENIVFIDD